MEGFGLEYSGLYKYGEIFNSLVHIVLKSLRMLNYS
jgi:hypothetical protein